jgi:hypothetical protein
MIFSQVNSLHRWEFTASSNPALLLKINTTDIDLVGMVFPHRTILARTSNNMRCGIDTLQASPASFHISSCARGSARQDSVALDPPKQYRTRDRMIYWVFFQGSDTRCCRIHKIRKSCGFWTVLQLCKPATSEIDRSQYDVASVCTSTFSCGSSIAIVLELVEGVASPVSRSLMSNLS